LYFIVMGQLGFFRESLGSGAAWERFYGGDAGVATEALVPHRPWNDPHWQGLYSREILVSGEDLADLGPRIEVTPTAEASLRKLPRSVISGITSLLRGKISEGMRITSISIDEQEDPELRDWKQLTYTIRTPSSLEAAVAYWEQISQGISQLREHLNEKDREVLDSTVALEVKAEESLGV
jgi:hypothetical protein